MSSHAKRPLLQVLVYLLLAALIAGCGTSSLFQTTSERGEYGDLPPDSTLRYTIFLIGDAGAPGRDTTEANFRILQQALLDAGERSAVVFLGDNIYPSGLPPITSLDRQDAERRIDAQLAMVEEYEGRVAFVPGNHDWGGLGLGGDRNAVLRQEIYVESRLDRGNTFVPDRGYPGPVTIPLGDDAMLVAIDTQWWLEDNKVFGNTGTYQLESEGEFLLELDDVLWQHSDKHLVVVAHHPVFTNGEHGGHFKGLRSLFTGELFSRRYLGTPQDLSNLKYRHLREGLLSVFQHHRDLIYAAGHDHSLQYFHHNDQHYVVSGSGSKLGYAHTGHGASFTAERKGYAEVRYHTDGSIWLAFYSPDERSEAELLYVRRIRGTNAPLVAFERKEEAQPGDLASRSDTSRVRPSVGPVSSTSEVDTLSVRRMTDVEDDDEGAARLAKEAANRPSLELPEQTPYTFASKGTVSAAANPDYETGAFGRFFLGKHYRRVWAMPVSVPVIDLEKTAGGLTPLKKGGGLQTMSLRLIGEDGDQYVLRSIDKDPSATIPEYLRKTIAQDAVQDQIAAMHPYAAFTLPRMARAAGIYHTHPTLVYVGDDERLGFYRSVFGNTLALFESRADEDQSDEVRFGNAENVIGSTKLLEEIREDNDERVDERAYARARLFDMLIGDWDRHKDQWRWAEFDVSPGKIYRPVPRDRDFAYFRFDGFLPRLIKLSGNPRFRRFTDFESGYHDLYGLNFNGAANDRRFTSSLTEEDWLEIADTLRSALTDEVIDEAVRDFPPSVYEYHGEDVARTLKERRDHVGDAASKYYKMLAENVDVVGSDKHERFEVTRLDDDRTLIVMYKTKKEGDIDRELYRRVLKTSETREVRLYGLDGRDVFMVTGSTRDGIRVRAIGGPGEDTFVDSSSVAGGSRHTIFHDTVEGNEWMVGRETEIIRSNDPKNNDYTMRRFELDERRPLVHFSSNSDDGLLLGGGVKIVKHGFGKDPYAAQHRLYGSAATKRLAFNLHYRGYFVERVGSWDGYLGADARADRNFRNFYGFGNETNFTDRYHYLSRIGGISVRPGLYREPLPFTTFRFGPTFEFTRVEEPTISFPGFERRLTDEDFQDKYYAGAQAEFNIDGTDTLAATRHGLRWLNSVRANVGVRNTGNVYVRLASEVSYFYTFYTPTRVTIGLRAGGATNIGDFEFYQANTLGGQENLRGYRKTRFAGHSAVFTNVDVRVQLLEFNIYLMRGLAGILGFFDNGRVWADGEKSDVWHPGYGGGIWIAPFDVFAMTATMGFSPDDTLFNITMGFQF